ncbi:MAG: DEAD/DEAH box helicase [Acidobacteriota bacterium]
MSIKTFQELGLGAPIVKALSKLNITNPTEIQSKTLPLAMAGNNIVATAQTGSGKTAAFLLPIIARLKPTGKLRAVILAPTRELAKQIETNAKSFAAGSGLRCLSIVGGESFSKQFQALRAGVDILIATPGRLNDLINRNAISFKLIEVFVLDEADRMLDMGFLPQVRQLIKHLPVKRQTMLMTATLSKAVEKLVFELMRDYVRVDANPLTTTVETLTQKAYPVLAHAKTPFLLALLKEQPNKTFLVFTQTRHGADKLVRILTANNHQAVTLHSSRSQSQRNAALAKFRSGRARVLVATDIAARGIDVDDIAFVVNYEVPATAEDYIHRVGRTARAGRDGAAVTLVSPEEEFTLESIERSTGIKLERLRLKGFSDGRSEKQILLANEINRLRAMQARSYRPRA